MITIAYVFGHKVVLEEAAWRYADTGEPVDGAAPRPCGECGEWPTPEGHDPCLGTLPGVLNACCGHGNPSEAYVVLPGGKRLVGDEARAFVRQARPG